MTTTLLFEGHGIDTYGGQDFEMNFRSKSIILLTGPAGSGKTSAIQTLLYPLGVPGNFRRAVRENVSSAWTSINVEGSSYRLVRSMARRSGLVQVYEGRSRERILTPDVAGKDGPTPSQWLFEQMGVQKLLGDVRLGGPQGRHAGFGDFLPLFYISQQDNDRQVMRHLTHDSARKTVFELVLGISDARVEDAKVRLAGVERRLSELKRRILTIEAFVSEDPADADELREEMRQAVSDARRAAQRVKELRARTEQAQRVRRPPEGGGTWSECPRCRTDLRRRTPRKGHCQLCMEPEPPTRSGPVGASENGAKPSQDPQELARTLGEAMAEAARLDELIKGLRRLLEPHQRLARLHEQRNTLTSERTEAAAALAAAKKTPPPGTATGWRSSAPAFGRLSGN
jgi:energy-coupling factor transporter ATP-binding protein EcfA2